jgi:hypothetical protein
MHTHMQKDQEIQYLKEVLGRIHRVAVRICDERQVGVDTTTVSAQWLAEVTDEALKPREERLRA